MEQAELTIIGHVRTCYGEKFGVPRQPGLVGEAWGELIFTPDYRNEDALRALDGFSHLWLLFIFHEAMREGWHATVRPPRLGGNKRIGVFATRSPFRPNPIGLSVVKLEQINWKAREGPTLKLLGVDLVDGTPIIDIKPYLPYADSIPSATTGFAPQPLNKLDITWLEGADANLPKETKRLIEHTLTLDPRPSYQENQQNREYGCLINGYNIRWKITVNTVIIISCEYQ